MKVIAHRGAHQGVHHRHLENSIPAFNSAIACGADGIEFDVYFVSGNAYVIHDASLLRTHHIDLAVVELNDALAKTYAIATLAEVVALVPHNMLLNIEIKDCDDIGFMRDYMHQLHIGQALGEHCIYSSFDQHWLDELKPLQLPGRMGALTTGLPSDLARYAIEAEAHIACINKEAVTRAFVQHAQQNALEVWVYTVDLAEDWQRLRAIGVDAIFTNTPQEAVDYFK